jgi:hypothetical protein
MFLFEVLDVAKTEADKSPNHKMANAVDGVVDESIEDFSRDFPAAGEILFCQDLASGLWYALDGRGLAAVVH